MLTWDASGGTTRKQARADLNIEKVTRNLTIYKKDQETQRTLKGALFSLWHMTEMDTAKRSAISRICRMEVTR